jgi:hypothetical protein
MLYALYVWMRTGDELFGSSNRLALRIANGTRPFCIAAQDREPAVGAFFDINFLAAHVRAFLRSWLNPLRDRSVTRSGL